MKGDPSLKASARLAALSIVNRLKVADDGSASGVVRVRDVSADTHCSPKTVQRAMARLCDGPDPYFHRRRHYLDRGARDYVWQFSLPAARVPESARTDFPAGPPVKFAGGERQE